VVEESRVDRRAVRGLLRRRVQACQEQPERFNDLGKLPVGRTLLERLLEQIRDVSIFDTRRFRD
jgi:hypothetical protein